MDEKLYEIATKYFGVVKGTRSQIIAFRSALQSEADKSYDRSKDIRKPMQVRSAWEVYWTDCLTELRHFDDIFEKQVADVYDN